MHKNSRIRQKMKEMDESVIGNMLREFGKEVSCRQMILGSTSEIRNLPVAHKPTEGG